LHIISKSSKIGRTNLAEPFAWTFTGDEKTTAAVVATVATATVKIAAEIAAKL
jgi:hypothetical protein